MSSPPPKSYFARRFDRIQSGDNSFNEDEPIASSPIPFDGSKITINPMLGDESDLLIDLTSPTEAQPSGTANFTSDEQR